MTLLQEVIASSLRQRVLLSNTFRLLLCIQVSFMLFVCSHGTFVLSEQEDNEVIFEGERIRLECRAPNDVSNPQFRLLDSQNNVLVDQDFNFHADGHFGYPNEGAVNFEILITSINQNRYLCEILKDSVAVSREEIGLNVVPRDSPQCYINTSRSASVSIGDVISFSCYQEVGIVQNPGFRWVQVLRDGTVNEQLPLEYSDLINQFKRKLSSSIIVSSNDNGSEFECSLMESGSERSCKTGVISIQQNQNQNIQLTISPDRAYTLDRGGFQFFSCESSDPRYDVFWVQNTTYQSTHVNVMFFSSLLSVSIPTDTLLMDGQLLTFICAATFDGSFKSEILFVTINFLASLNSPTPKVTSTAATTTTQLTQAMLTFNPATVPPLDRGDTVEIECSPSLENYEVSWIITETLSERDAEIDTIGATLHIHIPADTTLMSGDVLTFVCRASSSGINVNKQLTVNVDFTFIITTTLSRPISPQIDTSDGFITSLMYQNMTKSDLDEGRDNNDRNDLDGGTNNANNGAGIDYTIFIVIAAIVAVILVVIIFIILFVICMMRKADHMTQEERKFRNAAYNFNDFEDTSVNYAAMDKNGSDTPGPDLVPYSDVSRGRHVIKIDEDEIYDDSKDWRGSTEI